MKEKCLIFVTPFCF